MRALPLQHTFHEAAPQPTRQIAISTRLAAAQQDQGRGIAVGLLQDAIARTTLIAEHAGIRAMLTYPTNEAAASFTPASVLSHPHCGSNRCCCSSTMRAAGWSNAAREINQPL